MIRLTRLPEPDILKRKGVEWTTAFLASSAPRPESKRYRHADVVRALRAISHGKCFYCERAVAEADGEVDHYVEVVHDRSLAYAWTNLYWSCRGCNDKLPEDSVPRGGCIDPFDPAVDPVEHLAYDAEQIRSRADSARGRSTIEKYDLDRQELRLERSRALNRFYEALITWQRAGCPPEGVEILRAFAQRDRPFSAMFAPLVAQLLD